MLLSGGQAGDNPYLLPVLDAIAIRGPAGGRLRKRPDLLLAGKGYAHDRTRAALRRRGIPHNIPERRDQIARRAARGSRGGRPPAFSREDYKQRNGHRAPMDSDRGGLAACLEGVPATPGHRGSLSTKISASLEGSDRAGRARRPRRRTETK